MTQPQDNWEALFDEKFTNEWKPGHRHDERCEWVCCLRGLIKDFIAIQIEHARQEVKEEMRRELAENPLMVVSADGEINLSDSFERVRQEERKKVIKEIDEIAEEFDHDPAVCLSIINETFHGGRDADNLY